MFLVELNGVLTKYGLLSVVSTMYGTGGGETPTKLFFQEVYLGNVLQLSVNNTILWCPMRKEVMDGIIIWGWLKVRYETAAKLGPLCNFFRENIWLLNLMVNGLLVGFVFQFQSLEIMQQ